jgi:ElaB/YqjD/DUF883 family membrane-anchored ribosome-binding protein
MKKPPAAAGNQAPSVDELAQLLKEARAVLGWYRSSSSEEVAEICEKIDAALSRLR